LGYFDHETRETIPFDHYKLEEFAVHFARALAEYVMVKE
jgi:hypothetical protein